ncbi:MAG: hypothetical protein WDW36_000861 [Sanguina aurantia]
MRNTSQEKRAAKKEARLAKRAASDDEDVAAGADTQGGFAVNLDDPRFADMMTSHLYALDPTDPRYAKTPAGQEYAKQVTRRKPQPSGGGAAGASVAVDSSLPSSSGAEAGAAEGAQERQSQGLQKLELRAMVAKLKRKAGGPEASAEATVQTQTEAVRAVAVAQEQKQATISYTESLELSIYHVTYMRGLFPDAHFKGIDMLNLDGMHIKMLTPACDEAKRLIHWVESGVTDALKKGYLKSLFYGISRNQEGTELLEEYIFNFAYEANGSIVMENASAKTGKGKRTVHKNTVSGVRYQVCHMMRMLCQICQTLDKVPDERYQFMKMTYHDHTPAEYEPPYFVPAEHDGVGHFPREPFSMQVGALTTEHHDISLKVKSVLDACEDPCDLEGQGEQAHPEMAESCEVSGDEEMSSGLDQAGTSQQTGSEQGGDSADNNDEMQDQCESAVEETEAAAESVRVGNTLQPPYSQAARAAHAAPTAAAHSNKAPDSHVAMSPSLGPLSMQTPAPLPTHHVPAAVERLQMAKPTAAAPGPGSGGNSKAKGKLEAPEDRVQADVAGLGTEVQDMPGNNAPAARKPLVAPETHTKTAAAVKGKAASLIPSIIVNVNATDASEAGEPGDMSEDDTEMPAIPVELEGGLAQCGAVDVSDLLAQFVEISDTVIDLFISHLQHEGILASTNTPDLYLVVKGVQDREGMCVDEAPRHVISAGAAVESVKPGPGRQGIPQQVPMDSEEGGIYSGLTGGEATQSLRGPEKRVGNNKNKRVTGAAVVSAKALAAGPISPESQGDGITQTAPVFFDSSQQSTMKPSKVRKASYVADPIQQGPNCKRPNTRATPRSGRMGNMAST